MINLTNTKYGTRRKAILGGVSFDLLQKNLQVLFYVQLVDNNGNLLDDLSIVQNRSVAYNLTNNINVDLNFNIVETGGKGEYDYFIELMQTMTLPELVIQLAHKLNSRNIFN